MNETTPPEISPQIVAAFLAQAGHQPVYVPVRPAAHAQLLACFPNVDRQVQLNGGQAVTGRLAWTDPEVRYLNFEAHAVWRTPAGDLVDVTPKADGEERVLFAPDPRVAYRGRLIPSQYLPLVDDPEVHAFCRWQQAATRRAIEVLQALHRGPVRHETGTGPGTNPRERAERRRREQKRKKKR
jgi:hypothetical protein